MGRFSGIIADICVLLSFIGWIEAFQYRAQGSLRDPWILPRTVRVTSDPSACNVTVTFKSSGRTDIQWTTNDGFSPTDLHKQTAVSTESKGSDTIAKISLPFELPLEVLRLHLINAEHAYEIHLEFDVYHGIPPTFIDINPYTLFVPPNTDIGISSRGQTQFHIFTNTSGTPFTFGMLQADVTSLISGQIDQVVHDVAYSFLPDNDNAKIRLSRRIEAEGVYHSDVVLNAKEVYRNGGIISIMAACSAPNSIIKRLDTKQLLYLKSKPGRQPVAKNSVGFINMSPYSNTVKAAESENALIRCKAVGNPAPAITLYRNSGEVIEPYLVPQYSSKQAYETMTVFQFLNVTRADEGVYICRVSVKDKFKDSEHPLTVSSGSKQSLKLTV